MLLARLDGVVLDRTTQWLLAAIQGVRYSIVAAHCLQLYEWLHNLEDELRLVYRSSWTSVKVAYLLCRYYPLLYWPVMEWAFVGDHPLELCHQIIRPIHGLFMPLTLPAQAVLLMRAYAFSGRSIVVLILLSLCYAFLIGTHVWLFWVNTPIFTWDQNCRMASVRGGVGCFPDYRVKALGRRVLLAMLAVVAMNLLTLVIVVFYCLRRPSRQTSLGRYFMRQGLNSFAYTAIISIVSLTIYFKGRGSIGGIGLPFIFVLPDILACRLILQLRSRTMLSDSQISRLHSRIIRNALSSSNDARMINSDIWVIDDP